MNERTLITCYCRIQLLQLLLVTTVLELRFVRFEGMAEDQGGGSGAGSLEAALERAGGDDDRLDTTVPGGGSSSSGCEEGGR